MFKITIPMPIQVLHPAKLSASDHKNIGRLIRACAELEFMLTNYLFKVAGVDLGTGTALLGKQPSSKRLSLLRKLAKPRTEQAANISKLFVKSKYSELVEARNVLAHGALMGHDYAGGYCFQIDSWDFDLDENEQGKYSHYAQHFGPGDLRRHADEAEALVKLVDATLGLEPLHERHLSRSFRGR